MQNKIKDLRIRIDELSQLVKELRPFETRRINIAKIPDGWNSQEFLKVSQEHRYSIEDGEKGIEPIPYYFKELENSYNSLILAKAWLGKVLQELGSDSPYKNDGKRKTVDDIEPTVDTYRDSSISGIPSFPININTHIEKVDWLREEIRLLIFRINKLPIVTIQTESYPKLELYIEYSNKYMHEARFWLGFELMRCKNE